MIISRSLKKKKKKNNNRLVKSLIKKEPPKKPTKEELREFNEWVNKKKTGINSEIFQKYISFQRPSNMLKAVYTTNDKKKNNRLVNVIQSKLSDLKNKIKYMEEEEIKKSNETIDVAEKIRV